VVRTWWTLEPVEKAAIAKRMGEKALRSDEVVVTKGYDNEAYWSVDIDEPTVVAHLVSTSALHDEEKQQLGEAKTVVELKAGVAATPEASPRLQELLKRIDSDFPDADAERGVIKLLTLPKFLLFSQYQRMQGQVSLEEVKKKKANKKLDGDDEVFIALCEMAGTTIEQAESIKDFEGIVSRFEGASNKITSEIFRYWSQNKYLKVHFRFDLAPTR
jgi:hypothetical protein